MRNGWILGRKVDAIFSQRMDILLVFNVKGSGENLTNDSTNSMPSFFKHESFQTMVSLAEIQIYFVWVFFF